MTCPDYVHPVEEHLTVQYSVHSMVMFGGLPTNYDAIIALIVKMATAAARGAVTLKIDSIATCPALDHDSQPGHFDQKQMRGHLLKCSYCNFMLTLTVKQHMHARRSLETQQKYAVSLSMVCNRVPLCGHEKSPCYLAAILNLAVLFANNLNHTVDLWPGFLVSVLD